MITFKSSIVLEDTQLELHTYKSIAVWTGFEPATFAVTGRHSNQLNYQTVF